MCVCFFWKHSKRFEYWWCIKLGAKRVNQRFQFCIPKENSHDKLWTLSYTNWMPRFWIMGGGGDPSQCSLPVVTSLSLNWNERRHQPGVCYSSSGNLVVELFCSLPNMWRVTRSIVLSSFHCFLQEPANGWGAFSWRWLLFFYYVWLITCHCFTEVGLQWEDSGDFQITSIFPSHFSYLEITSGDVQILHNEAEGFVRTLQLDKCFFFFFSPQNVLKDGWLF